MSGDGFKNLTEVKFLDAKRVPHDGQDQPWGKPRKPLILRNPGLGQANFFFIKLDYKF